MEKAYTVKYLMPSRAASSTVRSTTLHFKKMNKANELTEDDQKLGEEKIQKMTDKFIEKVDKEVENKTKEIMTD